MMQPPKRIKPAGPEVRACRLIRSEWTRFSLFSFSRCFFSRLFHVELLHGEIQVFIADLNDLVEGLQLSFIFDMNEEEIKAMEQINGGIYTDLGCKDQRCSHNHKVETGRRRIVEYK